MKNDTKMIVKIKAINLLILNEDFIFFFTTKDAWSPINLWVFVYEMIDGQVLNEVSDNNNSDLKNWTIFIWSKS